MTLKFLQETNQSILDKLKTDLSYIDSTFNLDQYMSMTAAKLSTRLQQVRESINEMKTGTYGSWLRNEDYVRDTLIEDVLKVLIEQKRSDMRSERLITGSTYYTNVSRYGDILEGHKAIFVGPKFTGWMPFRESVAIAKAMVVLRHGSSDDFREIYVGMADGRPDGLNEVSIQHVVNSSDEALGLIEDYCDSRWEGPWPWEIEAPEKLKYMIERREENTMKRINEMQRHFSHILREFDESNMNQFEMVAAAQEMMSKVDSIISDLGKLSATGIEVMAQSRSAGDEDGVGPMQAALGEPLNGAVSALIDLKSALSGAMGDDAVSPIDGGDDMGSPMDAMGDDPMGDDPIGDVDIGGDAEERPIKEL